MDVRKYSEFTVSYVRRTQLCVWPRESGEKHSSSRGPKYTQHLLLSVLGHASLIYPFHVKLVKFSNTRVYIMKEEAEMTHKKSGNSSKMWLAFQPYYDQVVNEGPTLLEYVFSRERSQEGVKR